MAGTKCEDRKHRGDDACGVCVRARCPDDMPSLQRDPKLDLVVVEPYENGVSPFVPEAAKREKVIYQR